MKTSDLFFMALKNLWRRKLRTALTIIGVIIGCTSIIVMVSFGFAQKKQLEDMTGSTSALQNISVTPTNYFDPSSGEKPPKDGVINDEVIAKIEKLSNVDSVLYNKKLDPNNRGKKLNIGKYVYYGDIAGMDEKMLKDSGIEVTEGRVFDPNSKDIEIIVSNFANYMLRKSNGGEIAPEEMQNIDLFNERGTLTLGGNSGGSMGPMSMSMGAMSMSMDSGSASEGTASSKSYKVVVVGKMQEDFFGGTPSIIAPKEKVEELNEVLDDLSGVKKTSKKVNYYDNIKVKVKDTKQIDKTTQAIVDMGLSARNDTEFIDQLNQGTMIMQIILGGIGGISLLVAAIGITNTMVMSIYERTKEIGVMKVIGAKISDIRNLFLLEAGMIGFFGGLIGVVLSLGISTAMNSAYRSFAENSGMASSGGEAYISIIKPELAIGALVICFLIGIITGYYPAVRATKLSAIEAIKTE